MEPPDQSPGETDGLIHWLSASLIHSVGDWLKCEREKLEVLRFCSSVSSQISSDIMLVVLQVSRYQLGATDCVMMVMVRWSEREEIFSPLEFNCLFPSYIFSSNSQSGDSGGGKQCGGR